MEVLMSKQKFQYSVAYSAKDRNLTNKEIIFLRKLCRVNGKQLIDDIRVNPSHKFYEFFLDVWHCYKHQQRSHGDFHSIDCWEALCEVEPGSFRNSYWLDRGAQQKKTYRTNRFDENLRHATWTMSHGQWKDLPILWKINTDLSLNQNYEARIRDITSYVIASNSSEASTVWETMVINPLNLISQRQSHARFIGPASHFSFSQLNSDALKQTKLEIEEKRAKIEETLEQLKNLQSRSEFAFALINQTLAMVDPSDS